MQEHSFDISNINFVDKIRINKENIYLWNEKGQSEMYVFDSVTIKYLTQFKFCEYPNNVFFYLDFLFFAYEKSIKVINTRNFKRMGSIEIPGIIM